MVDALPTTNPSDQTHTLTPGPDAVQELKGFTTSFSGKDPSLPRGDRTITRWLNPDAFVASLANTLGFVPRFHLHGPGVNWDLSLMRDFRLYERLRMQFRGEAYSATYHPQWDNPGTGLNNPNTSGVITSAGGARSIELATRYFF